MTLRTAIKSTLTPFGLQLETPDSKSTNDTWLTQPEARRSSTIPRLTFYSGLWIALLTWNTVYADVSAQTSDARTARPSDTGKPGDYRLIRSNDDPICSSFARILAKSRSKAGDLDFSKRDDRIKWKNPAPSVVLDPPMQVADFDINNDGVVDRVFRVAWSTSGNSTDALYIQQIPNPREPILIDKESIDKITRSGIQINLFDSGNRIIELEKRYGKDGSDWWIGGQVFIDAIRVTKKIYVVAWNYEIPSQYLAQAYVFQVGRDGQPMDVCMFARICPCSGCIGRVSELEQKLLPTSKYCRKP